ncbi:MAG TPA: hypothetical protein VK477_02360, partial [Acidobacteriota bacterium]|nr:hypothetical protein [Acidobacteriota bacterium]
SDQRGRHGGVGVHAAPPAPPLDATLTNGADQLTSGGSGKFDLVGGVELGLKPQLVWPSALARARAWLAARTR